MIITNYKNKTFPNCVKQYYLSKTDHTVSLNILPKDLGELNIAKMVSVKWGKWSLSFVYLVSV